ncbi:SMODS domain-containing nucleotidyltransferase [Variovorax sp. PvP013]|uniref:SMODS domain-containing nucleotidyltransferase n=1 Tax=Variovorax sp. PvP013 TaxID=3156435 RepID=UPI003D1F1BD2
MELNPQFRDFLSNIRPTDRQKEEWQTGARTLRNRLSNDAKMSKLIVSTFLQGSIRRSTAIRPVGDKRPDVDIVVVTNIDYNDTTPKQAMDLFVPFLDEHYRGKWEPQGRSFGIVLSFVELDLVITSLPVDQRSRAMEDLYRSQSVLNDSTLEDDSTWRLNRSWTPSGGGLFPSTVLTEDAPESDWKPNPLFLPDRDVGNWGRTHPLAQIQWTAAKNRRCNKHYLNVVRALKWWRQTNIEKLPKYPKGYPLEHLIGNALTDGTASTAAGLVQALETIRDRWAAMVEQGEKPVLPDHGVPEHDVLKRLSVEDFAAFHEAVSGAAEQARAAYDSTDAQESARLWQALFGSKFPAPGPQGGDRPRDGFTQPARPADPPPTQRFA